MGIAACLYLLVSLSAPAAETDLLLNGSFDRGTSGWSLPSSGVIAQQGPNGGRSFSVRIDRPGANPWDIQVEQMINEFLPLGAPLTLEFWARSDNGQKISAHLQESSDPWDKHLSTDATLKTDWQKFVVKGALGKPLAGGQSAVVFHLAYNSGTVHLAGIRLLGPDTAFPDLATPQKPVDLLGPWGEDKPAWTKGDSKASLDLVWENQPARGEVMKLTSRKGPAIANIWDLQVQKPIAKAIKLQDTLYLTFWARSLNGGEFWVVHEQNGPPHSKSIFRKLTPGKTWQEYKIAFKSAMAFGPNQSVYKFFTGTTEGSVEFSGLKLRNFGANPPQTLVPVTEKDYKRETNWQQAAEARIRKHRMGQASIDIQDAKGKPIAGAKVSAKLIKHNFKFGTAVTANLINDSSETGIAYKKALQDGFNTVVFENDMKWGAWQEQTMPQTIKAAEWLKSQGFSIRGHNMVWGSNQYLPENLRSLSTEEKRKAVRERISWAAKATKGLIYTWDVVNEAATETSLWQELGWDEFTNSYKLARTLMPGVKLTYNDFNISNENSGTAQRKLAIDRAKQILKAGPYLDIFGDQGHMNVPAVPIDRVLASWDEVWAGVKKPIEITEFDFSSWDEESHSQYTEDYLTAAYSHPHVEAFLFWGFWEGAHWLGQQGGHSINRDWTPRAAWKTYINLLKNKWATKASATTNNQGKAVFRGTYGEYEIEITVKGKMKKLRAKHRPNSPLNMVVKA